MLAVVEIQGNQYKIQENDEINVPLLTEEEGGSVTFDRVLLLDNDGEITIGNPTVPNAQIHTTVLGHGKEKKITVFKMKRRKGHRVKRGHRQQYTSIRIDKITV